MRTARTRLAAVYILALVLLLNVRNCLTSSQQDKDEVEVRKKNEDAASQVASSPSLYAATDLKSVVSSTDESGSISDSSSEISKEDEKVIELTARNFGQMLSSPWFWSSSSSSSSTNKKPKKRRVWLIEFHSPRCSHCVMFSSTYAEIARIYHSAPERYNIKVAKINSDAETILTRRFNVEALPSFFVVDGYSVYTFGNRQRSKRNLMKYAEGGYKDDDPIPFIISPMGPAGLLQGTMIVIGVFFMDTFEWIQTTFGLSTLLTSMIMLGTMFMSVFFALVFFAIAATPREKRD